MRVDYYPYFGNDNYFQRPDFRNLFLFATTVLGTRLCASTSRDQFFTLVLLVLSVLRLSCGISVYLVLLFSDTRVLKFLES